LLKLRHNDLNHLENYPKAPRALPEIEQDMSELNSDRLLSTQSFTIIGKRGLTVAGCCKL